MVDQELSAARDPLAGTWVDDILLTGGGDDCCLWLREPISRQQLRVTIEDRQHRLTAAGLRAGGSVVLCLPPSVEYVANLLAVWRIGAQVTVLDHRLTQHEVDNAVR